MSYSREIAPILAFHCHRCHEGPGLDTRTYDGLLRGGSLGPAVIPGDPERSPLVQFVEGRRGEARRMPLNAPPLAPGQLETIRRWVAEGAREDRDTTPRYRLSIPGVRRGRLEVAARSPAPAYLIFSLRDKNGRLLFTRAAPGRSVTWRVQPERGWPRRLTAELTIAYAPSPPQGASLTVNSRTAVLSTP